MEQFPSQKTAIICISQSVKTGKYGRDFEISNYFLYQSVGKYVYAINHVVTCHIKNQPQV